MGVRLDRVETRLGGVETRVGALESQAGIALENVLLYEEVKTLFDSFVKAAVTAIESRDPTTSGHSRRSMGCSPGGSSQ